VLKLSVPCGAEKRSPIVNRDFGPAQRSCRAPAALVNGGAIASIREFPLLARTVEIALVEKIAQALFEARRRRTANECVNVGRAQIPIPFEDLEYLNVARGQLNTLSRSCSFHSGPASLRFHSERFITRTRWLKRASCSGMFNDKHERYAMFALSFRREPRFPRSPPH
jgi:hypothetical protein